MTESLKSYDTVQGVDNSEIPAYHGYDDEVSSKVHNLARAMSKSSYESSGSPLVRKLSNMSQIPGINSIPNEDRYIDPRLDPDSEEFDSTFWVKNLRKLYNSDPSFFKPSSLGVAFKNLRAYGIATDDDYQTTFTNGVFKIISQTIRNFINKKNEDAKCDILKPMEGIMKPGDVTVVLGRPGSGCSTFLKTIASQTYGFQVDPNSSISYNGLTPKDIENHFRGTVIYCAENESHFPHLTVGDTLEFAAKLRTPQNRPDGVSREEYMDHMTKVIMAMYGLSHTKNTKVGNDFIRGVSGGERKRVSIAEVALSFASLQCWDNSTRGLDSATALEFVKALKTSASVLDATPLIAIYQCSQDAYKLFDKVVLLYEGHQIFFGDCIHAKEYFINMGYECPQRQTTPDFLTSLTNPAERIVRPGFEEKVPRTSKEFYDFWQKSPERQALLGEVDDYLSSTDNEKRVKEFKEAHNARQSNHTRGASSYTVSYPMQIKYLIGRNILRIKGSPSITIATVVSRVVMGFIISSMFYNQKNNTGSFYFRTAAMFYTVLFNSFSALLEIFALYEARSIVEKHKTYAFYHPSADALASVITDFPIKIVSSTLFNLILYFMVNLRRNPGHFFFFLLINFTATLTMSHIFRTIGSVTKSLPQAMTPASVILLAMSIFTGFVIPIPYMLGWSRWINYIDPLGYAFEALVANEFHDREFECVALVPSGPGYPTSGDSVMCSVVGSKAGSIMVNGDDYMNTSFSYYNSHKWRNWGILLAFAIFFLFVYVSICEYNKGARQKGEILVFQKSALKKKKTRDIESGQTEQVNLEFSNEKYVDDETNNKLPSTGNIFHWRNLTYEVKIKSDFRCILNDVDGWVKPGQVTALMGASGAGKTTLLNALSDRLTSGVITSGNRMVNGNALDASFQRSIGYVQQQDLHLQTSTVRESLQFSAYLRQPRTVPKTEKDSYVDYVIRLLEMEEYSDAVVGVPGEGLNVEQRKRLSIGVELVAKPKLLVFLDEPTSGLDSQTAWSICKLIRKLADHGQAILCTIHQPSAILLKGFDRLLFLQKGGQTVYFGDLGENCQTLINYFEKYGAPKCPPDANPTEWMLEIIGAAPGSHANQDYYEVWKNSSEYREVKNELDRMEEELIKRPKDDSKENMRIYAMPLWYQYLQVTHRVFQQYWRTPTYVYSKIVLSIINPLFNGFVFFKAKNTIQGLQNQMFSIFLFLVIYMTLVQQYLPNYISQRNLYETRERHSRTFSWFSFIISQITGEIPWQILCGTIAFFCWYYPVGLYKNAEPTDSVAERGALMWVLVVLFFIFCSTMAQLCVSFNELADNAANLASMLFIMSLLFCGVLVSSDAMPRFWIFMYRCSPFSYLVNAILSVGMANSDVVCNDTELLKIKPVNGQTCGEYMKNYILKAGGYLVNSDSRDTCEYCSMSSTNEFLKQRGADYDEKSQNIGIFACFIAIDIIGTIFFYWLARVPKKNRQKN